MRVAFFTLGCKVNQFETGAMERLLTEQGHIIVGWQAPADAYVINTCTVTAESDRKCRQVIRAVRKRQPEAVVAVCGCLGQADPGAIASIGADLVSGTADRTGFVSRLEEHVSLGRLPGTHVSSVEEKQSFETLLAGPADGRTRALLKIQDGCDNRCAYCVIPLVRGAARSLPLQTAVSEASRLAEEGFRELVVTGIEISSWGSDLDGDLTLADALEGVCHASRETRVRLGSLDPRTITPDFVARIGGLANLCPHFHISLQSGCDTTLTRMGRRYDTALYANTLTLLREAFPGCALTTDLIVGFPGEDEAEFSATLRFVEQCAFSAIHIFPFSHRIGTPAADMEGQVTRAVKRERAARVRELARRMADAYAERQIGRVLQVLFEESDEQVACGHAENYLRVVCRGDTPPKRGQMLPVCVTGISKSRELVGEV